MIQKSVAICVLITVLWTPLLAHAEDVYFFDSIHPEKSKCKKADRAQNQRFKKMACEKNETNFGGTDKPAYQLCKDKKKTADYLLYRTQKDCKEARATELANGS